MYNYFDLLFKMIICYIYINVNCIMILIKMN